MLVTWGVWSLAPAARKLLVYSWVLLRDEIDYPEFLRRASVRDLPVGLYGHQ